MKYVIVQVEDDKSLTIDSVTDRPSEYLSSFEPIDVIDGQKLVWDEKGNVFHIEGSKNVARLKPGQKFGIVNVGAWDFENGGPTLVRVRVDKNALRTLLTNYLTQDRTLRRGLWRRTKTVSAAFSKDQCSKMSLPELIRQVEVHLPPS